VAMEQAAFEQQPLSLSGLGPLLTWLSATQSPNLHSECNLTQNSLLFPISGSFGGWSQSVNGGD
jgi:hypothetical protein